MSPRPIRTAILLATAITATAASATSTPVAYGYNFSSNSNTSVTGGDNSRTFSTTVGGKTISVTATGWNATKITSGQNSGKYTYSQGWLGRFQGGLGITSDNYDLGGDYNLHQIDNLGVKSNGWYYSTVPSYDFVVLQFDTAVTLGSITRNGYGTLNSSLNGYVTDMDFAWTSLSSMVSAGIYAGLPGVTNVASSCSGNGVCTATSTIYTQSAANEGNASNIWLIGASMNNTDGKVDGFKLGGVSAFYTAPTPPPPPPPPAAVPEPATWAMLILGFGLVGGAMRRRSAGRVLA